METTDTTKTMTLKTKIIAGVSATALILTAGIGAWALSDPGIKAQCADATQSMNVQANELTSETEAARATLALLGGEFAADDAQSEASQSGDAAQSGAAHTAGYLDVAENKAAVEALVAALDAADKAADAKSACATSEELDAVQSALTGSAKALTDLKAAHKTVAESLTTYRTEAATKEGASAMDKAKADLAAAIKAAKDAQAKAANEKGDKAVADAAATLKKAEEAAAALSTDATATDYDSAVAVIKKAKAVAKSATDLNASVKKVNDAVAQVVAARTPAPAPAATPAAESYTEESYSGGGYSEPSYSGSNDYVAPTAPAAPSGGGNAGGGSDNGFVDLSQFDTVGDNGTGHGCVWIEGKEVCL